MSALLMDWPEGNPAALGAARREILTGSPFAFHYKTGGSPTVTLARRPPLSSAAIVNGTLTADKPGLYIVGVDGTACELVAVDPAALVCLGVLHGHADERIGADLRLRSLVNDPRCTVARIAASIEVPHVGTGHRPPHGQPGALLPIDP